MNGPIKISVSRAPALIPGMVDAIKKAKNPLILVPESFTLTTEQALVRATPGKGFIGTQVFSTTSLIREIRERAGFPDKSVITADGRHMVLSLLLLKNKNSLLFYKENVNQIGMAEKLAEQIDDLTDGGFSFSNLVNASEKMKKSTVYKCHDIALLWEEYQNVLNSGYVDQHTEWSIALDRLEGSGLFQGMDLLIYGFDYINMNLTELVTTAYPLVNTITIGLISETGCPDDHIFEVASNSVKRFTKRMAKEGVKIPVELEAYRLDDSHTDPGIRFIEQNIYAIYCRDNKRVSDTLSRELVKETLNQHTNQYQKLANICYDKQCQSFGYNGVVDDEDVDAEGFCRRAEDLFELYQQCANRKQVETVCLTYLRMLEATKVSIKGNLYFVPKHTMAKVDAFESFIEELNEGNRNDTPLTANSFYIIDDAKQRDKMTEEFYIAVKKEIAEYQEKADYLIKSGSRSPATLERWVVKIASLEEKKRHYEEILRRELDGLDDEFGDLKLLSQKLAIRARGLRVKKAA